MVVLGYFLMILIGVMICVKVVEVAIDTYSEHEHTGRTYWQSFLEVIGWYEMTENVEKIFGEEEIKTRVFIDGELYSEGIEVERILPIVTDEYLAEGKELECCPRIAGGTDYYFCSKEIEKPEKFTTKDVLKQVKADQINHPKHYTQGNIECLDAIKESLTQEGYKGYLKGNIMKYLWRYEYKNGYEDLGKANFYLDKLIKENDID